MHSVMKSSSARRMQGPLENTSLLQCGDSLIVRCIRLIERVQAYESLYSVAFFYPRWKTVLSEKDSS